MDGVEEVMRYAVIKICLDKDGNYSIDHPQIDAGGSVGYGTTYAEPAVIERLVARTMNELHEYMLEKIKQREDGK